MHIGLFDLEWRGHHTPYDSLISQYLIETDNGVTFVTSENHPNINEFPDSNDFNHVSIDGGIVETDGGNIIKVLRDQTTKIKQCVAMLRTVNRADIDVLHIPTIDYLEVPLAIATQIVRPEIPVVATLHQDHFVSNTSDVRVPKRAFDAFNRCSLRSLLESDKFKNLIVHSNRMRHRLVENVPGVSEDTTVRIPAPTPDIKQDISPTQARRRLNLPESETLLLFFGGLRYDKGPDLLAEAMANLEITENVTLVYAGPERHFTETDVRRWKRNASQNVQIMDHLGYIPEEEVDLYFIAADALLLPYRRTVGISGPLRRACMADTHIIGNEESDIGEIINGNNLGQTFETASIESLSNIITHFVEHVEEYPSPDVLSYGQSCHWRKAGEELTNVYEEVTE